MINGKSHTRFRLVPKSTTSGDLEGPLRTVFQNMRLSEPTTKIWMKINYQRRRWSRMTVVSDSIRFMRFDKCVRETPPNIYPHYADIRSVSLKSRDHGPCLKRRRRTTGVVENAIFSAFGRHIFGTLRSKAKIINFYYIVLFSPLPPSSFHWPQNTWTWMAILR